ncbi:hypothetical protein M4D55_15750 [Metabacillus idriensis]|uniref:hypothetical protein n=1 Tax=Metabacillus idriensis TaxID=324768 RepID=UPI00203D89DC|nr:hypothetical protein [Metabacillus idriensis]MCM3597229.1 hypothetical protein [Metabacillus idriensis]
MRKRTYVFIAFLILLAMIITDNLRMDNVAEELQNEKDKLSEQVSAFKQDKAKRLNQIEETMNENERLKSNISELEKEIESIKSPVSYKDFLEAVRTVEEYKGEESFGKAIDYFAYSMYTNFGTIKGNCPCSVSFRNRAIEWRPNSVLDLEEFKIEGERIFLTYKTSEMIGYDYQFAMIKSKGFNDEAISWRIEYIRSLVK